MDNNKIQAPWKAYGTRVNFAKNAGGFDIDRCPNAEEKARLIAAAPDMFNALIALTTNPHLDLGDMIYQVREREQLGWDGPAVTAWDKAVSAAKEAIAKANGSAS